MKHIACPYSGPHTLTLWTQIKLAREVSGCHIMSLLPFSRPTISVQRGLQSQIFFVGASGLSAHLS